MTRKEALEALLEKVEAGEDRYPFSWANAGYRTGSLFDNRADVNRAYHGSLDAVRALHEAVLPGWRIDTFNLDGEVVLDAPYGTAFGQIYGGSLNTGEVSRVWLIAILRALIAQEDHTDD